MAYCMHFGREPLGKCAELMWSSYAVIGAGGGAVSQIGDLAASAIKRKHNIKDYGKLIPGHGGILDRFDSVIFTAPIIYCLGRPFVGGMKTDMKKIAILGSTGSIGTQTLEVVSI